MDDTSPITQGNTVLCPACKLQTQPDWFFCPNCAKELKEKVPEISILKQVWIYFVSFFFSPLGLVWGLKYIRYHDNKVRIIGVISIALNIISIVIMINTLKSFVEQYGKLLNTLIPIQ